MNELFELLQPNFEKILIALVTFVAYKIREYVNSKVSKDKQDKIDNIIKASVVWVEQITDINVKYKSKEKFDFAKNRALELLKGAGLEVSEEYLDTLIEVFVNGLK